MGYAVFPPVIYLNPLEHAGKAFIRLYYKASPFISRRLKEASWIRNSQTYKCFVMHHTPQAIEMTRQHFQGLAKVDKTLATYTGPCACGLQKAPCSCSKRVPRKQNHWKRCL